MLIKLPDFDDDLVVKLKYRTGASTGSKAVLAAAEKYLPALATIDQQAQEIIDLKRKLSAARQTLEGARSAAAQLLEKTSQGDML